MNKNLILAIDTSGKCLSLALAENQQILNTYDSDTERGQSEVLVPLIQSLFEKSHRNIEEISTLVTAVGPGSFTGVRIGLATARGLALALDVPLWGISCFDCWAFGIEKPFVVALDTRRNDFYTQIFSFERKINPQLLNLNQILDLRLPVLTDKPDLFYQTDVKLLSLRQSTGQNMISLFHTQKECLLPPVAYYMREAEVSVAKRK